MPPKRRKAADPTDAPEPKKRITRSSTRAKTPEPDVAEPAPTKAARKAPKPSKSSSSKSIKAKPKRSDRNETGPEPAEAAPKAPKPTKTSSTKSTKAKATASKANVDSEVSGEADRHTTLTISENSIPKPITCHHYAATSKPNDDTPTLIFTHGAGGTLFAPAVVDFCTGYSTHAPVLAFQGSMNLKSRTRGFHACITHLASASDNTKSLVLGGRSMGARAAVIAATEHLGSSSSIDVKLVLASYPLKGPKDTRDQILLDLPPNVDVLFVVGDKDAMCPLDMLDGVRKKMAAKSKLVVVKGVDHGMHGGGKRKENNVGELAGMKACEWVCGKMDKELVEITGYDDEDAP